MALGIPPTIANGTNRIAVIFQTLAASSTFRKHKVLDIKKGLWLGIPTTIGSVIGAMIAVDIDEGIFKKAMVVIMFVMVFFLFYKPEQWLKGKSELISQKTGFFQLAIFFLIGLYGGFIHVGVGYFLLWALVMGAGYDLVRANALKVFIVFLYVPFSLFVFIYNDQVLLMYGLVHAIGNVIGALIASRYAIQKGAGFVRWVIVAVVIFTTLDVFGFIHFNEIFEFLK